MEKKWVVSTKQQCEKAGAAFYFKQDGVRKHLNGRELDSRIYDAMPVAAGWPLTPQLGSGS
jgi:protein gp37